MLDIMYDYLLAQYFVKIIYIVFQVTSLLVPKPPCPITHTHTPLFVILLFSQIELYIENYNINLNIQTFSHLHISNHINIKTLFHL